jgi:hypothetical protein
MQRRIGSSARLAAALWLATAVIADRATAEPPAEAIASEPELREWENWTPSVSLGITIFSQQTKATTYGAWHTNNTNVVPESAYRADCDPGPALSQCRWITELGDGNPLPVSFGQVFYKHDHLDGAAIPLTVELMAPAFVPEWIGKPRPFVDASYAWPREPKHPAAQARAGTQTALPSLEDLPRMQLDVRMKRMWSTGLGVAFQTELGGFPLQIRPSFHYFGQQADLLMVSRHLGVPNTPDPPQETINNSVTSSDEKSEVYHGFGPRLAFDVELARRGPVAFHLLTGVYLAYFPGDVHHLQRGIVTTPPGSGGSNPFTPEPLGNETYEFRFDRIQPGGSIALRVAWVGFSE